MTFRRRFWTDSGRKIIQKSSLIWSYKWPCEVKNQQIWPKKSKNSWFWPLYSSLYRGQFWPKKVKNDPPTPPHHFFDPFPENDGFPQGVEKGSKNSSRPGAPPGEPRILVENPILNRTGAPKWPPKSCCVEGGVRFGAPDVNFDQKWSKFDFRGLNSCFLLQIRLLPKKATIWE